MIKKIGKSYIFLLNICSDNKISIDWNYDWHCGSQYTVSAV